MGKIKDWCSKNWPYIVLVVIPIFVWVFHFHEQKISYDGSDWASFGSFLSGIYSPILTAGTLWILFKQLKFSKAMHKEQSDFQTTQVAIQDKVTADRKLKEKGDKLVRRANQSLTQMLANFETRKKEKLEEKLEDIKNLRLYQQFREVSLYDSFLEELKLSASKHSNGGINLHITDGTLKDTFLSASQELLLTLDSLKKEVGHSDMYNDARNDSFIRFPSNFLFKLEKQLRPNDKVEDLHFYPKLRRFDIIATINEN